MEHSRIRDWSESFAAGMVGAVALTSVHQLARRMTEAAPRMDVLGERAIGRAAAATCGTVPSRSTLHRWALAGDLLANSAYYSLVTCGRDAHVWTRAVGLGLAAGVGALVLPARIGLGDPPNSDQLANKVMTIAWYLLGGLAAAAAGQRIKGAARRSALANSAS
jgi:hypothetical protein